MATKHVCINAPDYTYTGKENTPQGLGYAAWGEIVGKMMHGRDGNLYMVIVKNRERTWKKVSEDIAKRMAREMPLITKVVSDVKETPETVEEKPIVVETKVEPMAEIVKPVDTEAKTEPVPVPVKEKKPRKPRAKKAESQNSTTEEIKPEHEADVEVAKAVDVEAKEEPAPVKEKKPRKPRVKKTEETKPDEQSESQGSNIVVAEEAVIAEEAKPAKEKKPRKPRAKKTEEVVAPVPAPAQEEVAEVSEIAKPAEPVKEKKPRKPRAKKAEETDAEPAKEKKERKPRAPTEYNKFLSIKLKELKISHPGLPREDYMKEAVEMWKLHKVAMDNKKADE